MVAEVPGRSVTTLLPKERGGPVRRVVRLQVHLPETLRAGVSEPMRDHTCVRYEEVEKHDGQQQPGHGRTPRRQKRARPHQDHSGEYRQLHCGGDGRLSR